MSRPPEPLVDRLRTQAERAMASDKSKATVTPLLERLVSVAPAGTPAANFAHRHLAEYRIEDHPWRALLHLRCLVKAGQADDAVHALSGLAHALLGNYLAAVAAYRRAVAAEPKNPWYRHNLGHLLDVALDRPGDALRHLEGAALAAKDDAEIAASLAHCLARLGQGERAETLARQAARTAPASADHQELLGWIRGGDMGKDGAASPGRKRRGARLAATPQAQAAGDAVTEILLPAMREFGFSPAQIERALEIYASYLSGGARGPSAANLVGKPSVVAAALEYATARLERIEGVTRASVARRYGVTPKAVSDRVGLLAGALAMPIP